MSVKDFDFMKNEVGTIKQQRASLLICSEFSEEEKTEYLAELKGFNDNDNIVWAFRNTDKIYDVGLLIFKDNNFKSFIRY